MNKLSRIVITVLVLALVASSVFAFSTSAFAAETKDTEVVTLTASNCDDSYCESRFQFKVGKTIKHGYTVSFLLKPHTTAADTTVSIVGASKESSGITTDPSFVTETLDADGNVNIVPVGEGWYHVSFEVEAYSDEGDVVEKYTSTYFYVKIGAGCVVGDKVSICNLTITKADGTSDTYNGSALTKVTTGLYDRPIADVTTETVAVPTAGLDFVVDNNSGDNGGNNEQPKWNGVDAGEFWNPDATPYTWKVNATLGGATNLPAVVLGATGGNTNITNVNDELIAALTTTTFVLPNNLIFAFSDGYGTNEIILAESYYDNLIVNELPYYGLSKTNSLTAKTGKDNVTTDSAAGGTALSTGFKTVYGYENLDKDQNPIPCISEVLREKFGKIIGVVTVGWAYDATPADFGGAHAVRGESATIAEQMLSFAPDLFIGEGMTDYQSTFNSLMKTTLAGQDIGMYTSWSKAVVATNDKLFIDLPDSEGYEIRYDTSYANLKSKDAPTISMLTAFSLTWLQAKSEANNNVGFFFMFENGQTDAAGHDNSHDDMIGEVNATDEMVAICLKFACENPDTIVVFSSDHETGGLTLRDGWETELKKAKFTTTGHSGQAVPVYSIGYTEYAKLFGYKMYNAQLGKLLAYVMGVDPSTYGAQEADYPKWGSIQSFIDGTAEPTISEETTPGKTDDIIIIDEDAKFTNTTLKIELDPSATAQKIVLSGLTVANHDMLKLAYSVPAGATHIVIYGGDGATMAKILDVACDNDTNFLKDLNHYYATFKAVEDFTQLVIEITGTFAEGDFVQMDNLVIATNVITFDDYDLTTVSGGNAVLLDAEGNVIKTQPTNDPISEKEPNPYVLPLAIGGGAIVIIAVVVVVILKAPAKKSEE